MPKVRKSMCYIMSTISIITNTLHMDRYVIMCLSPEYIIFNMVAHTVRIHIVQIWYMHVCIKSTRQRTIKVYYCILSLDIDLACLICQWSRLPEPWEVAFLIATALILAIINLLIWKFVLRNSSTMNRKLQLFTKHKASDEKRITKAKMEKSVGG